MVAALVIIIVLIVLGGAVTAARSIKIVQQFEQGIVFRFGRIEAKPRGPGVTVIRPIGDRMQKVNMQIVAMAVPAQDGITRDNVTVRVDAVVYFRVVDPIKAVVNVQNYLFAVSQQAQTSLRSIIGQSEMDQLLSERDAVNRELRRNIDEPTEGPWGIRVERVEIKDVSLPESMKRSMSRQAEAERERRARIITADGEYQASKRLAAAANVMARDPAALQLRLLQTVVEVAGEKNSTLVMPVPVELLRFFEKMAPAVRPQRHRRRRPRTWAMPRSRRPRRRSSTRPAPRRWSPRRSRRSPRSRRRPYPRYPRSRRRAYPRWTPRRSPRWRRQACPRPRRERQACPAPRRGPRTGTERRPTPIRCPASQLPPPAVAAARRAPAPAARVSPMQKWEYATVPLLVHATKEILDNWGDDGWELVSVVPGPSQEQLVAYLKRPKG